MPTGGCNGTNYFSSAYNYPDDDVHYYSRRDGVVRTASKYSPWTLPSARTIVKCSSSGASRMSDAQFAEHQEAVRSLPNNPMFLDDDSPAAVTMGDRMALHAAHHKIQNIQDRQCEQSEQLRAHTFQGNRLLGQSAQLTARSAHIQSDLRKTRRGIIVLTWIAIIFYSLYTIYVIVSLWLLIRNYRDNRRSPAP